MGRVRWPLNLIRILAWKRIYVLSLCACVFTKDKQTFFSKFCSRYTPPAYLPLKTPWPRMALNPRTQIWWRSLPSEINRGGKMNCCLFLLESEVLCPNVARSHKFFISLEKDSYLKRSIYNKRISLKEFLWFRNKPFIWRTDTPI